MSARVAADAAPAPPSDTFGNLSSDQLTLSAGEYNCQVTVLNPNRQKAAFWQAPVMVVQ
jgi:hypothetical protein